MTYSGTRKKTGGRVIAAPGIPATAILPRVVETHDNVLEEDVLEEDVLEVVRSRPHPALVQYPCFQTSLQ
jgi:hypothetical protein